MPVIRGALGIAGLLLIAWLLSSDRRRFPVKIVIAGLALQWILALLVLRTETGTRVFDVLGLIVKKVLEAGSAAAEFLFKPFAGEPHEFTWFANVGITILTTIILVATLSAVGYHYGILQRVVAAMAWVMRRSMGVSGAESLAAAANVFFGQTEAPLLVKPYIEKMTRSELMALMTVGFATVAAGIMATYISFVGGEDAALQQATARHLLTACLMSAPAAFVMAKIMVPESDPEAIARPARLTSEEPTKNLIDAITVGASQGMKLAINVLAMLIAFVALIELIDLILGAIGSRAMVKPMLAKIGLEELNLNGVLGLLFAPIAWLMGVESADCRSFGSLLGTAMATNEVIAYKSLGAMFQDDVMSPRSRLMATYSLCGFANISSIGIQIGGIGGLAPGRRRDLVSLGPRAMLGGAMGCWMTGCIAGILGG